jgi:chromatin segregation and condensation protein Rec8/ScpA/Scc1 (kleisin family)
MEKMNISVATEFINMASELLYYKSKALLPSGELDDDFFVPPLPPELVAKLLEYKKYQLSSMKLRELYDRQADCYFREVIPPVPEGEEEFVTMSLFDLLNAFVDIMSKGTAVEEKEIVLDEILVSDASISSSHCSNEREYRFPGALSESADPCGSHRDISRGT